MEKETVWTPRAPTCASVLRDTSTSMEELAVKVQQHAVIWFFPLLYGICVIGWGRVKSCRNAFRVYSSINFLIQYCCYVEHVYLLKWADRRYSPLSVLSWIWAPWLASTAVWAQSPTQAWCNSTHTQWPSNWTKLRQVISKEVLFLSTNWSIRCQNAWYRFVSGVRIGSVLLLVCLAKTLRAVVRQTAGSLAVKWPVVIRSRYSRSGSPRWTWGSAWTEGRFLIRAP